MTTADRHPDRPTRLDLTEASKTIRLWADSALAADVLSDFSGPWELRLPRRRLRRQVVQFPAPSTLQTAEAARDWERLARAAAAHHNVLGALVLWLATTAAGAILGVAVAGVGVPGVEVTIWSVIVGVITAAVLAVVALGFALVISGSSLRAVYVHGPVWNARADAYLRRAEELSLAAEAPAAVQGRRQRRAVTSARWRSLHTRRAAPRPRSARARAR